MCEIMNEIKNEGINEGIKSEKKETALGMLRDKMALTKIAQYTRLPVEQIRKIAAENNIPVQA